MDNKIAEIKNIDINEVKNEVAYVLSNDSGLFHFFKPLNRADKSLKIGDKVIYTIYSNLYSDMVDSIRKA